MCVPKLFSSLLGNTGIIEVKQNIYDTREKRLRTSIVHA